MIVGEPLIVILVSLDTKFITSLEQIITRPLYKGGLSYTRYYHKPSRINGSITLDINSNQYILIEITIGVFFLVQIR